MRCHCCMRRSVLLRCTLLTRLRFACLRTSLPIAHVLQLRSFTLMLCCVASRCWLVAGLLRGYAGFKAALQVLPAMMPTRPVNSSAGSPALHMSMGTQVMLCTLAAPMTPGLCVVTRDLSITVVLIREELVSHRLLHRAHATILLTAVATFCRAEHCAVGIYTCGTV